MKIFSKSKYFILSALYLILFLAAFLRLYGLNWDQNQHLHPDERFLTMVVDAVKWPSSLKEYLNPKISALNPYNAKFGFFVYGTLPMKMVKLAAELIKFDRYNYNNITLVGRLISAFFDLGVVLLVFKIGQKIFNQKIGLLAAFFYALSVLPIQLSHFFCVDTFLVFFLALSFYFLISTLYTPYLMLNAVFLGLSFGLALACKISALLFLPVIALVYLFIFVKNKNFLSLSFYFLLFTFCGYFSFRLADPRVFADGNFSHLALNSQFIANIKELKSFSNPNGYFPPSIQWLKTKPIIYPLKNILLWGLGLPLGFLVVSAVLYSLWQIILKIKRFGHSAIQPFSHFLILFWIILLFVYQGIQFIKPMRYFYPLYPFLAILAANFFYQIINLLRRRFNHKMAVCLSGWIAVLLLLVWPLSFMAIYNRPHSRVMASEWIYQNIPAGSTISCEHWDDCLPLAIKGKLGSLYQTETLHLYDLDTPEKWRKINQQLKKVDYLILSSNRLWGSIPKVPEKYPLTAKFYQDLLAGNLNFQKVAEITSYPKFSIFNFQFSIDDSSAEESFTVYDHPKVMIFERKRN